MLERFIHFEHKAGDPTTIAGYRIVPFSQALHIQNPWWHQWGLIWNRPASVMVVTPEGQEQILPVHDVTRQVQLSLFGASILVVLLISLIKKEKSR